MSAPRIRRAALVLLAGAGLAAPRAAAQDMELRAELSGRPLPQAYYDRVERDPGFFELRRGWAAAAAPEAGGPALATARRVGELRMVVMLGLFADSPEPAVSAASVRERLFGANPRGNLTDFYREISGGRVTVTGTVLPWVRTDYTRFDVAGNTFGLGDGPSVGPWLRQIVARLDPTVDFSRYDNDGPDGVPNSGDDDGYVDLAVFLFEGRDATCGGTGVWPHRAAISGWTGQGHATDDLRAGGHSIRVDDYLVQSTVNCDGTPQNIEVVAHETGHAFGLGDYYDASGGLLPGERRWVLGCWTLMAGGSWGCGDGAGPSRTDLPPHMGPYEKARLGWLDVRLTEPGWRRTYILPPVQQTGQVLRVPLRGPNEYLLLEYRPNTGFDARLPAGGVLVYQVDSLRPFRFACTGCARPYHVRLLEADGDGALVRTAAEGGNRGVAGDVWTGRRVLDAASRPALVLNSGEAANVALEIEVLGPEARIVVSTLPFVAPPSLLAPLLGSAGTAPAGDDRTALDYFGNRNGRYDLGDLRAYMRSRPHTVLPPA